MYRYGLVPVLVAALAAPALALTVDVCTDPTTDARVDDINGNNVFDAGDGFAAVGIVLVGGTIPEGGVISCSEVAGAKIGVFLARGRVIGGLPNAAPEDVAYVDWDLELPTLGSIHTTGLVKNTPTYSQAITGATGRVGDARGQALVQVLRAGGFQIRLLIPSAGTLDLLTTFEAELSGLQEVPPVDTRAGVHATLTMNPDNTLTYRVTTFGPITAFVAHIHRAPAGVNGDILIFLEGGPRVWQGTTRPLTPEELAALINGELYINVHTDGHPTGEIRGQIVFTAVIEAVIK
jgi:hypothetical protein